MSYWYPFCYYFTDNARTQNGVLQLCFVFKTNKT